MNLEKDRGKPSRRVDMNFFDNQTITLWSFDRKFTFVQFNRDLGKKETRKFGKTLRNL